MYDNEKIRTQEMHEQEIRTLTNNFDFKLSNTEK
jgi:hypothetical protein